MKLQGSFRDQTLHGQRLRAQGLTGKVKPFRDYAVSVWVMPAEAPKEEPVNRIQLPIRVPPADRQAWLSALKERLNGGQASLSTLRFETVEYPADGRLPAEFASVVIRKAGWPLPSPPSPPAPTVMITQLRDIRYFEPGWLYALALDEDLKGKEIGPFTGVVAFRIGERLHYALFA